MLNQDQLHRESFVEHLRVLQSAEEEAISVGRTPKSVLLKSEQGIEGLSR